VVQGQELLPTFLRLLGTTISRITTLTFVAAEMRHRIDAILPHGELVVRTVRQLLLNLKPTTLIFVAAGLIAPALILLLLLEISLRMELAMQRRTSSLLRPRAPDDWSLGRRSLSN
jgi:hypothetical protein